MVQERFGILISLLNAPRRSAQSDATSALKLLGLGTSPKQILISADPCLVELQHVRRVSREEHPHGSNDTLEKWICSIERFGLPGSKRVIQELQILYSSLITYAKVEAGS